jgi:predicted amidohydrolase
MNLDKVIRIKGGHVVDPATGESVVRDVLVVNGRIAEPREDCDSFVAEFSEIDATGCYVFPGLIDFHLHMFNGGTEIGLQPDSALLPQGVTGAVDQGSSGVANCDAFYSNVLARTSVRALAFLHVCPAGLVTRKYLENIDPANFDPIAIRDVFDRYHGVFIGLKVRQSVEIAGDFGLGPLERTLQIADDLGVPVVVHTTDPAGKIEDIASMLRPGDVFSHVYHGRGETIMSASGSIRPAILQARERGVLFDTGDGRVHYGLKQIRLALEQKFFPSTISTDLTAISQFSPLVFGLPFVMSKYLALGMNLTDVVRAVTHTPAKILGLDTMKHGTLQTGAYADISVFKYKDSNFIITDKAGDTVALQKVLSPQLTLRNGNVAFRNVEFL